MTDPSKLESLDEAAKRLGSLITDGPAGGAAPQKPRRYEIRVGRNRLTFKTAEEMAYLEKELECARCRSDVEKGWPLATECDVCGADRGHNSEWWKNHPGNSKRGAEERIEE